MDLAGRPQESGPMESSIPLRHPCWTLFSFNHPVINLIFKVGPDPRSWWGEMMVSYDRGRTFRNRIDFRNHYDLSDVNPSNYQTAAC